MDEEEFQLLKLVESRCLHAGVTPLELYMRQQGKCYLNIDVVSGTARLYCTDGEDFALTDGLANPTVECSICMTRFILELFKEKF